MELSSLHGAFDAAWLDGLAAWGVAMLVGVVAFVALADALETFFDAEAG